MHRIQRPNPNLPIMGYLPAGAVGSATTEDEHRQLATRLVGTATPLSHVVFQGLRRSEFAHIDRSPAVVRQVIQDIDESSRRYSADPKAISTAFDAAAATPEQKRLYDLDWIHKLAKYRALLSILVRDGMNTDHILWGKLQKLRDEIRLELGDRVLRQRETSEPTIAFYERIVWAALNLEHDPNGYYGKGKGVSREYLAWQPEFQAFCLKLCESSKVEEFSYKHFAAILCLADKRIDELKKLVHILEVYHHIDASNKKYASPVDLTQFKAARDCSWWPQFEAFAQTTTEKSSLVKFLQTMEFETTLNPATNTKSIRVRDALIRELSPLDLSTYKKAIESDWWADVVTFAKANGTQPDVIEYLKSLHIDVSSPETLRLFDAVLRELVHEKPSPAAVQWRSWSEYMEIEDDISKHPIFIPDWKSPLEIAAQRREVVESYLLSRFEERRGDSYRTVREGPVARAISADKTKDRVLYPEWRDGKAVLVRHLGFGTRVMFPTWAVDDRTGKLHSDIVGVLQLLPGGGTQHSNVNAMVFSAGVFSQPLTNLEGQVYMTPEGKPARLLPISFDHAYSAGGPKGSEFYDMKTNLTWLKSAMDFFAAEYSDLPSIAMGRSLGANYLEEILATGQLDADKFAAMVRFGSYLSTWSPYALKHLFGLDPEKVKVLVAKDGSRAQGNWDQLKMIFALDGLIHSGNEGARLLDPEVKMSESELTKEFLEALEANQRSQWTFDDEQKYAARLQALYTAEQSHHLSLNRPDLGLNDLKLNDIFDLDWNELSQTPHAWRAVHDYFAKVRVAAGIQEPSVRNLLNYGILDGEYPEAEAYSRWMRFAAVTGSGAYYYMGGHDPYDSRRSDPEVTEHARKFTGQFLGESINDWRESRGLPKLVAR